MRRPASLKWSFLPSLKWSFLPAFLVFAACSSNPVDKSTGDGAATSEGGPHRGGTPDGREGGGIEVGGGAGGTAGTGGAGTAGSAGAAGAGGATGGNTGTAGATGAAGSGGKGGSGGAGGGAGSPTPDAGAERPADAGDVCGALEAEYSAALVDARMCDPNLDRPTCQLLAEGTLACPGCKVHVDSTTGTDQVRARWVEAGCDKLPRVCPLALCLNPGAGSCVKKASGGTCSQNLLQPAGNAP